MRMLIAALLLTTIMGCDGLMMMPLVERLDDEQQRKVDLAWENMFETPDRLDKTMLVDAIIAARLHQYGVDSLRLVSEKYVGDDLVVMEVRYDREEPEFDEFTVTYIDQFGNELRRERYSREEVEQRRDFLFTSKSINEEMDEETRLALELREEKQNARMEEIREVLSPLTDDCQSDEDVEMQEETELQESTYIYVNGKWQKKEAGDEEQE